MRFVFVVWFEIFLEFVILINRLYYLWIVVFIFVE